MLDHIVATAESLLLARVDLSLGGRNQRNRRDSEVLKDAARLLCTKIGAQRQERVIGEGRKPEGHGQKTGR